MPTDTDWYPSDADELRTFYTNLNDKLPGMATKYAVATATLARVDANAKWIN